MPISTLVDLTVALLLATVGISAGAAGQGSGRSKPVKVQAGQAYVRGEFPAIILRSQMYPFKPNVRPKLAQQRLAGRHVTAPSSMHPGLRMNGNREQLFLTDDYGYIWQLNKRGKKVNAYTADCSGAEGAKVDHEGNLWVACTNTSTVNMYSRSKQIGTAAMVLNDTIAGVPYFTSDVAIGADGTVFASSLYAFYCGSSSCLFYPGQISYWLPGNGCSGCTPSGQVIDPNMNEQTYFLDVSSAGTLFVDYYGCNETFTVCGNGFDQITNPTTSPSVFNIVNVASGTIAAPGGVQVLENGAPTLLDQSAGTVTQYTATPFVWLTITQNVFGGCEPVADGLNAGETKMAVGDGGCNSVDIGDTSSDTWSLNANANFGDPIDAAYSPSNK